MLWEQSSKQNRQVSWLRGRKTDKNKHTRKYIMCQMVISAIKKNLSKRNKEWLGVARRSEVLCTVASQIRNF